jgi:signal peptidase II
MREMLAVRYSPYCRHREIPEHLSTMRRYLVFLIVPCIFLLDRWTKILVIQNLAYLESIDFTSFFSLVHARNFGGAFGFLAGYGFAKQIFTFLPLLIIAILAYMMLAYRFSMGKMFALALILSGAIGNIYDRLFLGYVTDFLDFYYQNWHWPAFNVADISISTGIGLWLFAELRETLKARKAGLRIKGK